MRPRARRERVVTAARGPRGRYRPWIDPRVMSPVLKPRPSQPIGVREPRPRTAVHQPPTHDRIGFSIHPSIDSSSRTRLTIIPPTSHSNHQPRRVACKVVSAHAEPKQIAVAGVAAAAILLDASSSLASTAAMQLFPMASHPEVDACVDAEADERRQIQHDHCDRGGVSTCGVDDPVGDRDVRRRRPMHWPDVADAVRRSVRDTARRARDGLGRAVARAKHATEKATERNTDEP